MGELRYALVLKESDGNTVYSFLGEERLIKAMLSAGCGDEQIVQTIDNVKKELTRAARKV
jgi:hypothetical protein